VKLYVIADEFGEIRATGQCAECDFPAGAIEGAGSYSTHYVLDGQLVEYTPTQAEAKQAFPGPGYRWDNTSMQWVAWA
jgi:hypothetical protein